MSRRHQANRRRAYGRRQHEVRERVERLDTADRYGVACRLPGASRLVPIASESFAASALPTGLPGRWATLRTAD